MAINDPAVDQPPRDGGLIGHIIAGQYRLEELIGRGGMGEVYRARQLRLARNVAIKICRLPDPGLDPFFDQRFLREAAAAAAIAHPHTVVIHDFGRESDEFMYLVMEYLEGHSLRIALRHAGSFPAQRCAHVGLQICQAMAEVHGRGLVHRDIKPSNVMLITRAGDPDTVKLLDFGLVKQIDEVSEITTRGTVLGSPRYASPEQLTPGARVDHRADIYSLGTVLYTMVTGQPPFNGDFRQVSSAHLNLPPPALDPALPVELREIIEACLEKSPEDRPQSMGAVADVLVGIAPPMARSGGWHPVEELEPDTHDTHDTHDELELEGDGEELGPVGSVESQTSMKARAPAPQAQAPRASRWPWVAALVGVVLALGIGVGVGRLGRPGSEPGPTPMELSGEVVFDLAGESPSPAAEIPLSEASPSSAPFSESRSTSTPSPRATARPTRTPAPTARPTPRPTPSPVRQVRTLQLAVDSDPTGAAVFFQGRSLGQTPLRRGLELGPEQSLPITLTLRAAGHHESRIQVGVDGRANARLEPEIQLPSGYKSSPY